MIGTIREAVDWLAGDGFLAYPTETVWGLGACADRPLAIRRLSEWKRRGADQPLAVLVASADAALGIGCSMDEGAQRLAQAFWPGPLTIVVPCAAGFAPGVARADGALGLRCSLDPVSQSLAAALESAGLGPLTSTSLNRSGRRPAENALEAEAMIQEGPERGLDAPLIFPGIFPGISPEISSIVSLWLISEGDDVAAGKPEQAPARPSSVIDCTGPRPKILREGAIASESLLEIWAG